MKKFNAMVLWGLISGAAFSNIVDVKDGERIDLVFSKINFNRLSVKGDSIAEIRFIEGTFTVDTGMSANQNSNNSVYLRPVFDDELTLFVETRNKHHFSLRVHSDDGDGKDIELVLNRKLPAVNNKSIKKAASANTAISQSKKFDESIIADMMARKTPKSFDENKVHGESMYLHKTIKMTLSKSYQGNGIASYVYLVENKDSKPVELKDEWFINNKNARTIKLTEHVLQPGQKAWLYSVYNTETRNHS